MEAYADGFFGIVTAAGYVPPVPGPGRNVHLALTLDLAYFRAVNRMAPAIVIEKALTNALRTGATVFPLLLAFDQPRARRMVPPTTPG